MEENEIVDVLSLNNDETLKQSIIKETDTQKVKDLINTFNLNIAKKNVLRIGKYNELVDLVNDQITLRLSKHPGEMSNQDLINYLTALNKSIEQTNKTIQSIDTSVPTIQVNQLNINTNASDLSRESREKIAAAISSVIKQSKQIAENDIEEAQLVEITNSSESNSDE